MAKVFVKRYLHCNKEDNFDLERHFNNPSLLYVGYEVELLYEIDTESGEYKIVGCDGKLLYEELTYRKFPLEEMGEKLNEE